MIKEELLAVFTETDPTQKSPYAIDDNKPMWPVLEQNGRTLYARPARTFERGRGEIDGVGYQWHDGAHWSGQGYKASFEYFLANVIGTALMEGANRVYTPCEAGSPAP